MNRDTLDKLLFKHGGKLDEFLLLGVRDTGNPKADTFNDLVGFATEEDIVLFAGTTDPGTWWTYNHINPPHGAAHYVEGFHKGLFAVGLHFDQEAFRQVGKAKIWRDDNENMTKDEGDPEQFGLFGMNFHSAKDSPKIGQWSAGCIVVQKSKDLATIVARAKATARYKANKNTAFDFLLVDKNESLT